MPFIPPLLSVVEGPETPVANERAALQDADRMAGQLLARATVAAMHQIQQLQRLERVLQTVSRCGFVATSFTAYAMEAPTITIETPADALLDALESRYSLCGKFQREGSTLWLVIDGVRVEWHIERETDGGDGLRRAA